MMKTLLQILHAEDNELDAELAHSLLENSGIECAVTRVDTESGFIKGLERPDLDIILCDFSMPKFNGMSALRIAREHRPAVPFIFLSGTIGEEPAVESLKRGATDYVIKDRMSRLPSCVRRAMDEAEESARRAERETRIREQAALLDRARDAICLYDMDLQILYWNQGAERVYGWKAHEALGRRADELLFQDDQAGAVEAMRNLIHTGDWKGQMSQITRDGRTIMVESRWTLMRDYESHPRTMLVINTDITEKKAMEARLLRAQRVETVGALAGGIAHDLGLALAPVVLAASRLRREMATPESQKLMDMITGGASQAAGMVKQILDYSRGVGGPRSLFRVPPLLEEIAGLARKTFPHSIRVETRIPASLPLVTGNATQMRLAWWNLCLNARDAMPRGGTLTIAAEPEWLNASDLPADRGVTPGPYVAVTVADTGPGIPAEVRNKIFEPFFTAKGPALDAGLGLSTVVGILKTHDGFLGLSSQAGQGTSFKVHLPAHFQGLEFVKDSQERE